MTHRDRASPRRLAASRLPRNSFVVVMPQAAHSRAGRFISRPKTSKRPLMRSGHAHERPDRGGEAASYRINANSACGFAAAQGLAAEQGLAAVHGFFAAQGIAAPQGSTATVVAGAAAG